MELAPSIMYPSRQASVAAQHVYTRWDGEDIIMLMIYESVNNSAEKKRNDKQDG